MIRLSRSLQAWNTVEFELILKNEIAQIGVTALPLQQGLTQSSYAVDNGYEVMILGVTENSETIQARTGIFYSGLIPGCSCADDPTPVNEYTEYCELRFDIDKRTANTGVTLLSG